MKHEISGKVIHGEKYGRKIGFPTANLDRRSYSRRKQNIKLGIYAGYAEFKNSKFKIQNYPAGIVIGPLDKHHLPKIEAHLIGFKGNLYGIYLNIYLNIYLRPFKKYKSEAELKMQIKKDIKQITNFKYPISN
ncbi:MAG: riboflavin kinase [Patescibacteria group bacterium]